MISNLNKHTTYVLCMIIYSTLLYDEVEYHDSTCFAVSNVLRFRSIQLKSSIIDEVFLFRFQEEPLGSIRATALESVWSI